MSKPIISLACLVLVAGACGDNEGNAGDDIVGDFPIPDAAIDAPTAIDAGPVDAAPTIDAAPIDAALPDAGLVDAAPGACTPETIDLALDEIGRGFGLPTDIKSPPGDARIFVASKDGFVFVVDGDDNVLEDYFLDLSGDIGIDGERGLLGLAFHPDYAMNRRFFVFYTLESGAVTIAEGTASLANPDVADPELTPLYSKPHSSVSHNGGWIDFGPDGHLYAAIGDNLEGGFSSLDPARPFGKLLRFDVSTPGELAIPADNPFAGGGGAPEVWALGLRNPWRASFDSQTGDLYIADVGQSTYEEVDVQPAGSAGGLNYGWDVMEGFHCHIPATGCDMTGLTPPVFEYDRVGVGAAITGGYVYRGEAIPACWGTYFFADYRQSRVGSFRWPGSGDAVDVVEKWNALSPGGSGVTTFGVDRDGELLLGDGDVLWRLVAAP